MLFSDGAVASPGSGSRAGSGASPIGNGSADDSGSSRLGVCEMMQRAVTAARSSLLEVEDDAAIPTLHWPPDGPGDFKILQNSLIHHFLYYVMTCISVTQLVV